MMDSYDRFSFCPFVGHKLKRVPRHFLMRDYYHELDDDSLSEPKSTTTKTIRTAGKKASQLRERCRARMKTRINGRIGKYLKDGRRRRRSFFCCCVVILGSGRHRRSAFYCFLLRRGASV